MNAGLATGKDANCVLTGISPSVAAHTVNFFVRNDNEVLLELGNSMAQEICALFGRGFVEPCAPYLTVTPGSSTAFPGFITSNNSVNLSWGIYTSGLARPQLPPDLNAVWEHDPFDSTLYFEFNSQFVSGIPTIKQSGGGLCSNASTPGYNAPNYMYMCVPSYDTVSYQMEYALCLNAPGDPTSGETIPTFAACSGAPGGPYATNDFAVSSAALLTGSLYTSPSLHVPIDVTSLGNFGGNVGLTATISPSVPSNPLVGFSSNPFSVLISQGTEIVATMDVFVPSSAPANTYTITVTGSSGSLSHSITMTVVVTSNTATVQSSQTVLSSVSAGLIAEDLFGRGAYTIPVWVSNSNFAYLSNWQRVINAAGGVANYFTFLDAYSPNPAQTGTIRQGLSQNIRSVNPYIATTTWDFMVLGNIYDTLTGGNPASSAQSLNWMTVSSQTIQPANAGSLGYTPPPGTTVTYRMSLRSDMFWQNDNSGLHPAKAVTSWDVAFSYLSLLGTGSFQSVGASGLTGVTIINQMSFDLNLNAQGPFTPLYIGSLAILPGEYWSGAGLSTWNTDVDNTVGTCSHQPTASAVVGCFRAQYTLDPTNKIGTSTIPVVDCADSTILAGASGCSHIPASLLNVDTSKVTATYDPVANGILIGSGPWEAVTSGVVGGGTGVTPCGRMVCSTAPSYTLQRYGSVSSITASGCGVSDHYFRSNCTLAIWIWSGDNGDLTHDFQNLQTIRACSGVTPVPSQCVHWAYGIGGTGGTALTAVQIGAVNRFLGVNWVGGPAPSNFSWSTNPPTGIIALPPVLYDGPSTTLNPCSIDPVNGYDC